MPVNQSSRIGCINRKPSASLPFRHLINQPAPVICDTVLSLQQYGDHENIFFQLAQTSAQEIRTRPKEHHNLQPTLPTSRAPLPGASASSESQTCYPSIRRHHHGNLLHFQPKKPTASFRLRSRQPPGVDERCI